MNWGRMTQTGRGQRRVATEKEVGGDFQSNLVNPEGLTDAFPHLRGNQGVTLTVDVASIQIVVITPAMRLGWRRGWWLHPLNRGNQSTKQTRGSLEEPPAH